MGAMILDQHGTPLRQERRVKPRSMRALKAKYDAAQTTTENTRHWANADSYGPNASLDSSVRRTIRSRARHEVQNNTYAGGMVRTLANDTIGTGPRLQSLTEDKEANTQIEAAFDSWATSIRLAEKLRTMRMAKAVDGEAFASLFTNVPLRNPVKLDIQPHEAEMIASPMMAMQAGSLADGILFDDFGNVTAYLLLRTHPGEYGIQDETGADTVPARAMLHLFNCERPGQHRGCSEIASALPLYAQLRRYTLAVIRSAESAAMFSWLLKTQQSPSDMELGDEWETLETERGMGTVLPAGYEMQQLKAEQPTTMYEAFKRCIIAEIARCLSMPYNVAAGDSSGYNYSSGRLDHKTYYRSIGVEREFFTVSAIDPLYVAWWEEARLIGGLLPESVRKFELPPPHVWRWDGDEHVDPVKESNATETRLRIGITSYPDECGKLGSDWEVVQQQNAMALGMDIEDYRARLADSLLGPVKAAPVDPAQAMQDAIDNGDVSQGDNSNG